MNRHGISENLYAQIHYWLRKNFGKASKCESVTCSGKSKRYQWAKRKGRKYLFKRDNFHELCISCHHKLDSTRKARKALWEGNLNRKKTHCINGHLLTKDNIYIITRHSTGKKWRCCKMCMLVRDKEFKKLNKDKILEKQNIRRRRATLIRNVAHKSKE